MEALKIICLGLAFRALFYTVAIAIPFYILGLAIGSAVAGCFSCRFRSHGSNCTFPTRKSAECL